MKKFWVLAFCLVQKISYAGISAVETENSSSVKNCDSIKINSTDVAQMEKYMPRCRVTEGFVLTGDIRGNVAQQVAENEFRTALKNKNLKVVEIHCRKGNVYMGNSSLEVVASDQKGCRHKIVASFHTKGPSNKYLVKDVSGYMAPDEKSQFDMKKRTTLFQNPLAGNPGVPGSVPSLIRSSQ